MGCKSSSIKFQSAQWMSKNLNVEKFNNGDLIPEAKTAEEWMEAGKNKTPAFCYYGNEENLGEKYGKLYNWYAVNDERGLAPEGWHVATDQEWKRLIDELGGLKKATEVLTKGEFSSHLSGLRDMDGSFANEGHSAIYWTGTPLNSFLAHNRQIPGGDDEIGVGSSHYSMGFSIRCVKNVKE
ncbi:MAG: fibrobacter succinogenes major paralogous domain-containing protein [Bacteroidota bacterium]